MIGAAHTGYYVPQKHDTVVYAIQSQPAWTPPTTIRFPPYQHYVFESRRMDHLSEQKEEISLPVLYFLAAHPEGGNSFLILFHGLKT
jgi:hypothetical protein